MRPPRSLREWMAEVLPGRSPCARGAAWELMRALMVGFTTNLTQLARQADRDTPVRGARQFLGRWFKRKQWGPDPIYAALPRLLPQVWRGKQQIPLLMDCSFLGRGGEGWTVFQVSIPWEGRALPVYRVVTTRTNPEWGQTQVLLAACGWLAQVLPGPRSRYVLVLDRGFPSHRLIRELQAMEWRFVIRIKGEWKMTHPEFTGLLQNTAAKEDEARIYPDAVLGQCSSKGKPVDGRSSRVHVVTYYGVGHKEVWQLATTETSAVSAVRIYRMRMQIEAGFRDVKGPDGLDELIRWRDREGVARFLAWLAVYEWRLAFLWLSKGLAKVRSSFEQHGRISWIRTVREWVARDMRPPKHQAHACL